jgi:hypothetical protein
MGVAAAVVMGIVSLIGTGVSVGVQASENEKARKEAKKLANISRGDVLGENAAGRALTRQELYEKKRQYNLNRADAKEQQTYDRRKDILARATSSLSENRALQQDITNVWKRK